MQDWIIVIIAFYVILYVVPAALWVLSIAFLWRRGFWQIAGIVIAAPLAALLLSMTHVNSTNSVIERKLRASVTDSIRHPAPDTLVLIGNSLNFLHHCGQWDVEFRNKTAIRRIIFLSNRSSARPEGFDLPRRPRHKDDCPRAAIVGLPDDYLELRIGTETSAHMNGIALAFHGGPFELWHVGSDFERLVAAGGPTRDYKVPFWHCSVPFWGCRDATATSAIDAAANVRRFLLEWLPPA